MLRHGQKSSRENQKMDITESKLKPPENFPFPFTPYDIQKDFMSNLYNALEEKKLGVFESPTGTGKSLSLICGSLAWLIDHEKRMKCDINVNINGLKEKLNKVESTSDWMEAHAAQSKVQHKLDNLHAYLKKIIRKEQKLENIRFEAKQLLEVTKHKKENVSKFKKFNNKENQLRNDEIFKDSNEDLMDDDFILDDNFKKVDDENVSDDSDSEEQEDDEYSGVKIYFCSRTHSQLSQLVHEIQKSPYKDLNISVVTLSSRQNYCINDNVLKLKNLHLINEKCQDIHGKKTQNITKTSSMGKQLKKQKMSVGCPFYQQSNLENMKLNILTEIIDVEETVKLGKDLQGCPYYASRQAAPDAQIILVPYNTILHKSTRLACGLNLEDSIVIIDEAHNLLDAIENIYSSLLSGYQITCAYSQLVQYKDKYHDKFSPYNLLCLNQLIYILKSFIQKIGGKAGVHPDFELSEKNIMLETMAEFVHSCGIHTINLFNILEFSKKVKLTHKLHGFSLKYKPSVVICDTDNQEKKGVSSFLKTLSIKKDSINSAPVVEDSADYIEGNPLLSVLGFLESLTNHYEDGRIVTSRNKTIRESHIKFILLNPASHFSDIVTKARSVILAGGTMQPFAEFTDQLFLMAGGSSDRIVTFACGHVIQDDNVLPIIVTSGPTGKMFDFSYQSRNDPGTIEELGRLLVNVCNVIPSGVVCFFPSYEYENHVYNQLEKLNYITRIQNKKKVLREPKKSNKVEEVLKEYSKAAKRGALLLSVVGGKLSEGLNFNDELGRCVVVVGMPYPNMMNSELKEKMNYLDANMTAISGKEYYENLCMKAVNQSIGRSIRHRDDFASVLLVDHRYSRSQCQMALPNWIKKSLRVETKFGPVMGSLAKFFASRKAPVA